MNSCASDCNRISPSHISHWTQTCNYPPIPFRHHPWFRRCDEKRLGHTLSYHIAFRYSSPALLALVAFWIVQVAVAYCFVLWSLWVVSHHRSCEDFQTVGRYWFPWGFLFGLTNNPCAVALFCDAFRGILVLLLMGSVVLVRILAPLLVWHSHDSMNMAVLVYLVKRVPNVSYWHRCQDIRW